MRLACAFVCVGLTACAAATSGEMSETAGPAAALPAEASWLERARDAAARSAWPETAAALDAWAAQQSGSPNAEAGLDEEYWDLRLRVAVGVADAGAAATARAELLALLAAPREEPEEQFRAWQRAAVLQEQAGRFADAAALMELAAAHPAAGARGPAWWERASWLWERAGNRAAATSAIARALAGVELAAREQAALDRLRAFNLGVISTPEDAQAVLRFDGDPDLRLKAAEYLAGAAFEDDVAVFTRALSDPDPRILQLCLRTLAQRTGTGELAYVSARALPFTRHPELEVRLAALGLLAVTGSRAQVPALLAALQPEDRAGFRAARRALEAVTGHAEPAPLDPDLEGRRRLREAWLAWWKSEDGA